jgi:hypothetical protein
MSWLNAIGDLAERYAANSNQGSTEDTHEDFQQVVEAAPKDVVRHGIANMFRSDQTPPFPEMVSNLFSQSNQNQKTGLLNQLLSSVEPGALSSIPGLGSLAKLLGGTGENTQTVATQLSPEQVQQIATHAQNQDPSVIDRVSEFYTQHPGLMRAVGGLALSIAMKHMMRRAA